MTQAVLESTYDLTQFVSIPICYTGDQVYGL
jgi:hypothetical protein